MTSPGKAHTSERAEYLAEAMEHLVSASSAAEAFGALAGRLLCWLSCQLVVLQVRVAAREPLLFQGGGAVTLPGIGVGWRTGENPHAEALARGELVVHDDLLQSFAFGEDANLIRAGFRSAVRGALFAGGREVGRFGVFAEEPGHFTPDHLAILREVAPALAWLGRQAALAAQATAEAELGNRMDELLAAAGKGLRHALRACRIHLTRMIPAAGALVMVERPGSPPVVLVEKVGIPVPGVPETDDPAAWRHWLDNLPPGGHVGSAAWIFPIASGCGVAGVLALAFPQAGDDPEHWQRSLRPMIALLAMLVETERAHFQASLAARRQLGALAQGVADQVRNLMTELALQADLLQASLPDRPEARQRWEALMRLVRKGTGLSSRLEQMASSQRQPELWEPLGRVVARIAEYLRTYQGGKHLSLRSHLGKYSEALVEVGMVEQGVIQRVLALAEGGASEVRAVVRASRAEAEPGLLILWVAEEHGSQPDWSLSAPDANGGNGPSSGAGGPWILEVPTRSRF